MSVSVYRHGGAQTYRFKEIVNTKKIIDLTADQYLRDHREAKEELTCYDVLQGPCVPYYDFDNNYPSKRLHSSQTLTGQSRHCWKSLVQKGTIPLAISTWL
jgi:hypothetical protein